MKAPTLVICGDEDDHTLKVGIQLKQIIPACGLLVMPKTGHTMNLEEPDFFNRAVGDFLAAVELDSWSPRDPRADPGQILRTS
jgi:pimeloyl-ACP methyl ester carboxylesterase